MYTCTLLQVALRIFRNKTATIADIINKPYDPKMKAKGPIDVLRQCNITEVTPQMIAYAAVQVPSSLLSPFASGSNLFFAHPQTYIGLSSIPMWGDTHDAFNLVHFYHLIVKTLSDDTDGWVAKTVSWWKR